MKRKKTNLRLASLLMICSIVNVVFAQPDIDEINSSRMFYGMIQQLNKENSERALVFLESNLGISEKEALNLISYANEIMDSAKRINNSLLAEICSNQDSYTEDKIKIFDEIKAKESEYNMLISRSVDEGEVILGSSVSQSIREWINTEIRTKMVSTNSALALAEAEKTLDPAQFVNSVCNLQPTPFNG